MTSKINHLGYLIGRVITVYTYLLGHETVCTARHQKVLEFILIQNDVDENHISAFTDVKPAWTYHQLRTFCLGDVYCTRFTVLVQNNSLLVWYPLDWSPFNSLSGKEK